MDRRSAVPRRQHAIQAPRPDGSFVSLRTVIFAPNSRGQLALIIYEWADARYIGVDADGSGSGQNTWEDEVSCGFRAAGRIATSRLTATSYP